MGKAMRWGKVGLLLLTIALFLWVLYFLRSALVPFVLALIITYVFNPPVCYLQKKRVPRFLAIIIVYILVTGLVIITTFILIPVLLQELQAFIAKVPVYNAEIQNLIGRVQRIYSQANLPDGVQKLLDGYLVKSQDYVVKTVANVMGGILLIFSQAFNLIISPIIAFYFINDWDELKKKAVEILPKPIKGKITFLFREIDGVLSGYVRGQIIISLLVGSLTGIGLFLIGVNFSVMLGIIAGIANVIPYFGPFLGAIPAMIVAILQSPLMALKAMAVYSLVQQLECSVISPNVMGHNVGLHPLVIIAALLIGSKLFGVVGLVLAVPAVAILKVFISSLYRLRFEE